MGALADALALLAAALVSGVVLVLLLPVQLALAVTATPGERTHLRLDLGLLGGIVPRIGVVDCARRATKPPRPPAARRHRGRAEWLRSAPPAGAVARLLRDLIAAIRLRRLEIDAAFGLDDPAATGALWGAVAAPLHALSQARVSLRPEFGGAHLSGHARADLAFRPVATLLPLLRFLWAGLLAPRLRARSGGRG